MRTIEVRIGDRIYLEILPDGELEGSVDAEDETPKGTVTVVDLVPDIYSDR